MHTGSVQVSLKEDHKTGSYEYMAEMKERAREELPELSTYFQSGGMVDAVLNLGLPAPIDVQVAGSNLESAYTQRGQAGWSEIQKIPGVADVYIPQDMDYPALQLDIDRDARRELGLDQQEVVDNVITALTSNQMIAPSFWVDPKTGNDYMLTVQYPGAAGEEPERSAVDSAAGRQSAESDPARCRQQITRIQSPTEVDHYQIRRVIDIYVRPLKEELGASRTRIDKLIA